MAHFPRCPPAPAHRSVLPASFGRQSGKARCSYPCAVTPTIFPIDALLPKARDILDAYARLVLEAPPGAGKTTQVPLADRKSTRLNSTHYCASSTTASG